MGILSEYVESFEKRAHKAVEKLIQGDIYQEFREQIRADRYERNRTYIPKYSASLIL
jgi:hypothetical protein